MFKSFKSKLIGILTLGALIATTSNAAVLDAAQKTELTTALTAGYSEYIGLLVTVVAVVIPVVLISRFLWGKLGKGGNA